MENIITERQISVYDHKRQRKQQMLPVHSLETLLDIHSCGGFLFIVTERWRTSLKPQRSVQEELLRHVQGLRRWGDLRRDGSLKIERHPATITFGSLIHLQGTTDENRPACDCTGRDGWQNHNTLVSPKGSSTERSCSFLSYYTAAPTRLSVHTWKSHLSTSQPLKQQLSGRIVTLPSEHPCWFLIQKEDRITVSV